MVKTVTILVHDEIPLGKKRDDLHDWISVTEFRFLKKELQSAIIAKLMMEQNEGETVVRPRT